MSSNDEQQNVDRNYAVINLETYIHAALTGGWGFLYLAVGTAVYLTFTGLHAPRGCIMHVCGDGREFKPTPSVPILPPPPTPARNYLRGMEVVTISLAFPVQRIYQILSPKRVFTNSTVTNDYLFQ